MIGQTVFLTPGLWLAAGKETDFPFKKFPAKETTRYYQHPNVIFPHDRTLPNLPLPLVSQLISTFQISEEQIRIITFGLAVVGTLSLITNSLAFNKIFLILQWTSFSALILLDSLRLQAWLYIYLNIFISYIFHFSSTNKTNLDLLCILRTITGGVWLWSGLLKFNPDYPYGDFDFILLNLPRQYLPKPYLLFFAYLSAFFEFFLGFLALYVMFREINFTPGPESKNMVILKTFLVFASTAMHTLIIVNLLLKPYEYSVVPWNFAFIALGHYCFLPNEDQHLRLLEYLVQDTVVEKKMARKHHTFGMVHLGFISVAFVFLPVGCFFNKHDPYLSFSMYTTNDPAFIFLVPKRLFDLQDESLYPVFPKYETFKKGEESRSISCTRAINIFSCTVKEPCTNCKVCAKDPNEQMLIFKNHNWGFLETGSSVYPAVDVFEGIAEKICLSLKGKLQGEESELSKEKGLVEEIRFYISDKYSIPYDKERETIEYGCDFVRGGLKVYREKICSTHELHLS
eukprot:snap_masked-scaffold_8-processed-gene-3.44-mRNA-1 protein AED:1.00 eAED:1.00 QI:0/0/0/0/1/1/2/0/512